MSNLAGKRVLLIVPGGIAAFKIPELIRLLRGRDCGVTCVLTQSGAHFVTPLTLQALTETKVYSDLFSLTDENEMGHIQLSRSADLVVVAPATANILAKMARRDRRRSRHHAAAGHRQAGAGRPGDERIAAVLRICEIRTITADSSGSAPPTGRTAWPSTSPGCPTPPRCCRWSR